VRSETENYTVQSGDTVAAIAARFGVNVGTIINANKLSARASIKPGDTLKIPPVSGLLYAVKKGDTVGRIASLYKVDVTAIQQANNLSKEDALKIGQELVLPGAVPLPEPVKPKVAVKPNVPKTSIPGKSVDEYQESKTPPADARTKPADADVSAVKTTLIWPTTQHVINQYYGWRHTGVDIDGDYTDPIYASADGVVEVAGWNSGGYGLQIVVNHENGMKTRYAHASKLFVSAGERVKKGQVMAMVGTTGRSTGTHLHYEVYKNGGRVNPLAYIK
jgi:murein DD-endopeptidase MepM/ murein hydrolase activator NlpD